MRQISLERDFFNKGFRLSDRFLQILVKVTQIHKLGTKQQTRDNKKTENGTYLMLAIIL